MTGYSDAEYYVSFIVITFMVKYPYLTFEYVYANIDVVHGCSFLVFDAPIVWG